MASQAVIDAQRAQSDLSEARMSEIQASVAESQKQVGKVEDVAVLREEYAGNAAFLPKIESLCARFARIRRSRGDGNCFYRSFMFLHFQRLLEDDATGERITAAMTIASAIQRTLVDKLGYPALTTEDFYEAYAEFLTEELQ